MNQPVRARDLGIPIDGTPGEHNAITDVPGVEVGYCTLIYGAGELVIGRGPIRTGVTAILSRGRADAFIGVHAGCFSLNGNGELTGSHWVEESGLCEGPITMTNTHSCGVARDATVRWMVEHHMHDRDTWWGLPVAAESYDGILNDINGFHVTQEHVYQAIDSTRSGPIDMGSVGGGTGMICYDFKGGSGSASRRIQTDGGAYTLGVFVQSNFGRRHDLMVAGVPVGKHIGGGGIHAPARGSIIAVVATNAPLLPHQLKRLARRVPLGLARTGAFAHDDSGDIFIALSTANREALMPRTVTAPLVIEHLPNDHMDPIFEAVVRATEEAVLDSMIVNQTMTGRDNRTVRHLPHEELTALMKTRARSGSSPE